LDKKLDKLTSLKKKHPPRVVSIQDFEALYDLPKTSKSPSKSKIPLGLIDVFGPTKGRKGRVRYTYSKCTDKEVVSQILEIFPPWVFKEFIKIQDHCEAVCSGYCYRKAEEKSG